jgi:hypothetical protein
MSELFANGSRALAVCDVCGFQFRLSQLRKLVVNNIVTNTKACRACWVPDQPQLQLGAYPVSDPQAIREPRIDTSYRVSGLNSNGNPGGGSRIFEWGWAPVGGGIGLGELTPNALLAEGAVGDVTVTAS